MYIQSLGELEKRLEARGIQTAFEKRDVVALEAGFERERLLRKLAFLPKLS